MNRRNHKKHMPTLIILLVSWFILSAFTLLKKNTLYSSYTVDYVKEPVFTALLQGLGDHIYPFDSTSQTIPAVASDEVTSEVASTPDEDEVTVSSNTVTESTEASSEEDPSNEPVVYSFQHVEPSYFDDALFIGDSRTVGLRDYSATIHQATFYAKVSSTIYEIMDNPMIEVDSSEYTFYHESTISVRTALTHKKFGKIYIMVGINELGTGTPDTFYAQYEKVINDIRTLQPDAIIFIESIMHVTTERSNSDNIFNNININARNEKIKNLANDQDIFYIDLNEALDDESGGLNSDLTFDSVHLKASKYVKWEDFLLDHGIVK